MGNKDIFMKLLRLGICHTDTTEITDNVDWEGIKALAEMQGLSAVVLDGINKLKTENGKLTIGLSQKLLLQWIGEVMQGEAVYRRQQKTAAEMAALFHRHDICTYVLKGTVVAECYPKPEHRVSVDVDCMLVHADIEGIADNAEIDVWERGNRLIEEKGFMVKRDFYKNSTFLLPGLTVENHRYFTPFRGNKRLAALEKWLQSQLRDDSSEFRDSSKCLGSRIGDTCLYRPPVLVTALFLIEHAYSHFLHEGLTWRLVLDWMLFSKKHHDEIDWIVLNAKIDEFGFRKFYESFFRLGQYLVGKLQEYDSLSTQDKLMLEDIWSNLDLHETVYGVKGKLALVGNTWRARWKYKYFSDISMIHALWIQVKGFLFIKEPTLE